MGSQIEVEGVADEMEMILGERGVVVGGQRSCTSGGLKYSRN